LARENVVEQPMPREWWAALWKKEMTGIETVREVIGGAPIDPHLQLEGQEAAGGASTSAAGVIGRAEGGALATLLAFASFDSVLGHLGDVTVQGPELAKLAFSATLAANIPIFENQATELSTSSRRFNEMRKISGQPPSSSLAKP
jgi:hypothetical protein